MDKKLGKLLMQPKFVSEIIKLQSKEQIKDYFRKSGCEITDEEIENLRTALSKVYSKVSGLSDEEKKKLNKAKIRDLTPEELQKTSGGISNGGIGAIIGGVIGAGAVIKAEIAHGDKISSNVNKIIDKIIHAFRADDDLMLLYASFASLGYYPAALLGSIALGAASVTVVPVAAGAAAAGSAGYLIGKATEK